MKLTREWQIVWKPNNEIMDSVCVNSGVRMNANIKNRVDGIISSPSSNPEMEVRYFENGRQALKGKE